MGQAMVIRCRVCEWQADADERLEQCLRCGASLAPQEDPEPEPLPQAAGSGSVWPTLGA